MLGLGNGRRGMKSPPLLVAVLLACVLVLGINYWISSSRSIELQSRVMELEGRMRRAAAERGAVEIKKSEFEEKLAKQKGQIEEIHNLHMTQLESFNVRCTNEKAILIKNLTHKDQLLSKLQGDYRELARENDLLQQQMKGIRESLSRKLNYELEQCASKMKEISDQCEERLKKMNENVGGKADAMKVEEQAQPANPKEIELQKQESNNAIAEEQEEKNKNANEVIADRPKPTAGLKEVHPNLDKEDQGDQKNSRSVGDLNLGSLVNNGTPEEQAPPPQPSKPSKDSNPVQAQPGNDLGPYEEEDKLEAAEDEEPANQNSRKEINNEEVEREQLLNLDDQEEKEMAQDDTDQGNDDQEADNVGAKLPDYNGEEGNEPEPEAKKQAELAGNDINLKGPMENENDMNEQARDRQNEDREQRLK
ncbi:Golgi membrane protein 1 isoform X1 [Lissotriton helveticus]